MSTGAPLQSNLDLSKVLSVLILVAVVAGGFCVAKLQATGPPSTPDINNKSPLRPLCPNRRCPVQPDDDPPFRIVPGPGGRRRVQPSTSGATSDPASN